MAGRPRGSTKTNSAATSIMINKIKADAIPGVSRVSTRRGRWVLLAEEAMALEPGDAFEISVSTPSARTSASVGLKDAFKKANVDFDVLSRSISPTEHRIYVRRSAIPERVTLPEETQEEVNDKAAKKELVAA